MYRKPFYCVVCKMNRWPGDCGHTQFVAPDPATIEAIRAEKLAPEPLSDKELAAMVAPAGGNLSDEDLLRMVRAGRPTTRSYILGFDTTSIPAGTTATITKRPGVAFRPSRMVIPGSLGSDFDVIDIKIRGMSKLGIIPGVGTGLPACVFSETSIGANLGHLGLIEADDEISIVVRNTASAPRNFTAALIGHQEPERDPRSGGYLTDEDLAHLARAGVSAAPEEPDDDDKADEADEQKEAEEEDALEGDDDADLEEDDTEDSELEDDDDEEVDKDPDDEKDKEEEGKDEEEDDEIEAGPVGACCPHRLAAHDRETTKCTACGCDGFVFDGNDVMGNDIDAGNRKTIEARLMAALPSLVERMAGKSVFGDVEDEEAGHLFADYGSSIVAEATRLRDALARTHGERHAVLRSITPSVKKRFPLPFNEIEIGPWQTATVTVRPQMVCRIRRLVCEQAPGLFVLDIKVGKNSCTLSYADGMPLELFRAFPEDLSKAQIGAIERSGFFENVPQETVQVSMDLTLVVTNKSEVRQKFRAVMLTDAIDF